MSLTTRCPNCGTAFRVQPAQLSARGGKVRCGKCGHVFDGVQSLVAEGPVQSPSPAPADAEPSPQLGLFEAPKKLPIVGAANEDAPLPEFLDEAPPPQRRFGWALAALLALAAILAQVTYHFRTEIAVLVPETRPHLEAACALVKCVVRLPRYANAVRIESSEMHRQPLSETVVQVDATFRNYSPIAQEFPSLILTLTDSRDEVLARRIISPQEYLQERWNELTKSGMLGNSVVEVRIYFETNEKDALGYRLGLAYL
jgi:predicted Zn finger-like uncharacterized protein